MAKYDNYLSNLAVLRNAPEQDLTNEFIQSGIIDTFTMQFELAWKLLQKTLAYEGRLDAATSSPRGILKAAYATYDFIDEGTWLAMLDDRSAAQHVYDSILAERLVNSILNTYLPAFEQLQADLESIYDANLLQTF